MVGSAGDDLSSHGSGHPMGDAVYRCRLSVLCTGAMGMRSVWSDETVGRALPAAPHLDRRLRQLPCDALLERMFAIAHGNLHRPRMCGCIRCEYDLSPHCMPETGRGAN